MASAVSPELSGNQCLIRYERSVDPTVRKGNFSEEEDRLLFDAIKLYGHDWRRISSAVPGRTNAQCRGRFYSLAKGALDQAWSTDEDRRLMTAVEKWGQDWMKIWEIMGPQRTIPQVCPRFHFRYENTQYLL